MHELGTGEKRIVQVLAVVAVLDQQLAELWAWRHINTTNCGQHFILRPSS